MGSPSDFIVPQRTEEREGTTAYKLLFLGGGQSLGHYLIRGRTAPVWLKGVASKGGCGLSKMLGSGLSTVYKSEQWKLA